MRRKLTTEQFIERSRQIHGDLYDYSLVDYDRHDKKVKIICKKHGVFQQAGKHHFYGAGCPTCGIDKVIKKQRRTTEDFIKKAKKVHGNKYDYTLVDYVDLKTRVKITCKKHGIFEQSPSSHLSSKHCCKKCAGHITPSKEGFISRARKVHGDKYDYSKVVYKNSKDKVVVICKVHGEFYTTSTGHIHNRHGCRLCYYTPKATTIDFIKRSQEIHGDKYDYSLSQYKGMHVELKITCRKHGPFLKTPANHIYSKSGCPECSPKRTINTEVFIKLAKKVHGNKYDYSISKYNKKKSIIYIICPKHGLFKQTPDSHLKGHGCTECAGRKRRTTKSFIEDAISIHGNKYDYSQVIYINCFTPVKIICPKHGLFEQKPTNHIKSINGCPMCGGTYSYDTEEFVSKAKKKHGNKYTYKNCKYIRNNKIVTITCDKHGNFSQRAGDHLNGAGCPTCNSSKGESVIRESLLCLSVNFEEQKRFKTCKNKKPLPFDFYLPDHNLLIEYDGRQHYKPVSYWGGNKRFNTLKRNDQIKNNWCLDNGITLLRIPYTSFNKIEQILEKYINKYERTA